MSKELIGPEKAMEYLKTSPGNPRYGGADKVDSLKVNLYANTMSRGKWLVAQPIMFNSKGELIDGHHRLHAVIKSGRKILFNVERDLDPAVAEVIDRGSSRTLSGIMRYKGKNTYLSDAKTIAAIKTVIHLRKGTAYIRTHCTDDYIMDFAERYQDELERAAKLCAKKPLKYASCIASFFEAIMAGESQRMLEKLSETLATGMYQGEDETAAIILRDYLKDLYGKAGGGGIEKAALQCEYIQTCIDKYCQTIPLRRMPAKRSVVYTNINIKEGNIEL